MKMNRKGDNFLRAWLLRWVRALSLFAAIFRTIHILLFETYSTV